MKWAFFLLFVVVSVSLHVDRANATANIVKTINVDLNGQGDFTTIQQAIASVPAKNNQWIRIHASAGVYSEKVFIQEDKEFILLEGDGRESTRIEWGDYFGDQRNDNTTTSATFTSFANNFVAKNITFKNINTIGGQSVAALIKGNYSALYGCGFISIQDTLYDSKGLHYFKDCYIEGAVDFIFGDGQSIYEGCTIYTTNTSGYVTAQRREGPTKENGFVFKYCNVSGTQKADLGRAWGCYSRVIFYQTFMLDIVSPEGWNAWSCVGYEKDITYVEFECTGPGSGTSQRVNWMTKLSLAEVQKFTNMTYIDSEGWIEAQP